MKKFSLLFIGLALTHGLYAQNDVLEGDKKLSCEAILCLSSNVRPSECSPSLNRYFSINKRKLKDTIRARKNFLKICPIDEGENDKEFTGLRDDIISRIDNPCDLDILNSNLEMKCDYQDNRRKCGRNSGLIRISPVPDKSCSLLASSKYTKIRPKYVCSGEFYKAEDWRNGYTLTQIDKKTYERLKSKDANYVVKKTEPTTKERLITKFYVKKPINKNCWKFED